MDVDKKPSKTKGGARPGSGRKPGSPNKKTAEVQKAVAESGITPLEYMLTVMRAPEAEPRERLAAAGMAAPYVHAKLSSVEATVVHKGAVFAALLAAVSGTSLPVIEDE
jgi:hypothetical protein